MRNIYLQRATTTPRPRGLCTNVLDRLWTPHVFDQIGIVLGIGKDPISTLWRRVLSVSQGTRVPPVNAMTLANNKAHHRNACTRQWVNNVTRLPILVRNGNHLVRMNLPRTVKVPGANVFRHGNIQVRLRLVMFFIRPRAAVIIRQRNFLHTVNCPPYIQLNSNRVRFRHLLPRHPHRANVRHGNVTVTTIIVNMMKVGLQRIANNGLRLRLRHNDTIVSNFHICVEATSITNIHRFRSRDVPRARRGGITITNVNVAQGIPQRGVQRQLVKVIGVGTLLTTMVTHLRFSGRFIITKSIRVLRRVACKTAGRALVIARGSAIRPCTTMMHRTVGT